MPALSCRTLLADGTQTVDWLWTREKFALFGPAHLATLAIVALVAIGFTLERRALSSERSRRQLDRGLAIVILIVQGGMTVVMFLPGMFDVCRSVPLQICDVGWMLGVYALWTQRRWAAAVVYYWGLSATSLAMITPELLEAFPSFWFLMFFFGHGALAAMAVYLCWGVGLHPNWRLYRQTIAFTIGYAVFVYFVNAVLDTNFFCVSRKPPPGTMLDYFGPYPTHIVIATGIAVTAWALLTWPWTGGRQEADPISPSH